MFTTTLTSREWFQVYKYFWKTMRPYKYLRYFAFFWFIILDAFLLIYFSTRFSMIVLLIILIGSPFFDPVSLTLIIALIFCQLILFPSVLYQHVKFFSPKTYVIFENSPTINMVNQVLTHDPTAVISLYGIFTPPKDDDRTLVILKDHYLMFNPRYVPGQFWKKYNILVIKRTDITDETEFFAHLYLVYPRKIDRSWQALLDQ